MCKYKSAFLRAFQCLPYDLERDPPPHPSKGVRACIGIGTLLMLPPWQLAIASIRVHSQGPSFFRLLLKQCVRAREYKSAILRALLLKDPS